ncbi:MAG TPA: hypothetical protein VFA90_00035 [Terriglobales bacterium]|nr:hypothetical protein [Terriglobales bacterium]
METSISQSDTNVNLPPDFVAFLGGHPAGSKFNLWHLQGAMRFTRDGIPAVQTYSTELNTAQELDLIREVDEDEKTTAEFREEYGHHLCYGRTFVRQSTSASQALSAQDLRSTITDLELDLENAVDELRDFTEAHRDNPNAKDFLVSARESFMEPIRELYAQLRELRSVLKLKEAAAN